MPWKMIWKQLLGVGRDTVIEDISEELDADGEVVAMLARLRPRRWDQGRCPTCLQRCPWHDRGEGERRWRTLDLGTTKAFLVAVARRVNCRRHGVKVAWVPWAKHGSWFTHAFEDQVAWLTVATTETAARAPGSRSWEATPISTTSTSSATSRPQIPVTAAASTVTDDARVIIRSSHITQNSASTRSGGISNSATGHVRVTNTQIADNDARRAPTCSTAAARSSSTGIPYHLPPESRRPTGVSPVEVELISSVELGGREDSQGVVAACAVRQAGTCSR